jgi:hypothetical protein
MSDDIDRENEKLSHWIYKQLDLAQIEKVFSGKCDIDAEFMGFLTVYKRLSEIIPLNFSVVDLGSAYAPQGFFFRNHKAYIAVEPGDHELFIQPNQETFKMTAMRFCCQARYSILDQDETFAIASYTPPWYGENAITVARMSFKNVFTFYPHGGQY